ncbi:protein spinster homolog 1 isoform X2 [Daphnia magna]|uniref:protein spinster homolog 1 isoform X2 n=1 Tax=Daphnia magna TaxID=35525 RepID=UPI001E1BD8A9|nr:protein spinster homolog 1 isoform X2 [Daphnia magna]
MDSTNVNEQVPVQNGSYQTQPEETQNSIFDSHQKTDSYKQSLSSSSSTSFVAASVFNVYTGDSSLDSTKQKPSDDSGTPSISCPTKTSDEVKKMSTRQYATVIILCYVNLLKYIDRFTIAGILPEVQCAFGISDAQGGLLSTAFIASCMIFFPIFGYLSDRFSRRIIMGVGITLWGVSNVAGSFSGTYVLLLTSRILVGIGELMFSTVSPTIILDVGKGDVRSKFLSILYYSAVPVGSGLGFIVGAEMASAFGSWQWGLRVTPVLGFVAVLLIVFVVQEPPRGEAEGSRLSSTSGFCDDLKYLRKNKTYIFATFGKTLTSFVAGAMAWWGPKFIALGQATTKGEDVSYAKPVSSIVCAKAALAGIIGVTTGSLLGQKLRKCYPNADPKVCGYSMLIAALLFCSGYYVATGPPILTYVILFFAQWLLNVNWVPVHDILLYVVIPTRRATAAGFFIFIYHAFGDALSPYIIGLVSDSFKASLTNASETKMPSYDYYGDAMMLNESSVSNNCSGSSFIDPETVDIDFLSLRNTFFIGTIIAGELSAVFFFASAKYFVKDKALVDKAVTENNEMEQLEMTEQQTKFTAAKPEVPQMNLSTAFQEDACDVLARET